MALSAMAQRILRDPADALQWLRQCGVQRLETDSRRVQPGDAFVAWPGAAHEGRRFMAQAFQAGAVACLVDAQGLEAFPEALDERVAGLADLKRHLGDVAAAWADHPSRSMEVVAFTGTNGKTSSAWWMAQASTLLGQTSGLVGTLGIGKPPVGGQAGTLESSGLTTPDPVTLQQALARMKAQGMLRCAMEASSIGLAEHRLQGMAITVAVLTNFTQDHLDYHGTLDAYWAAKRSLFDWPTLRSVVINIDDPRGHALAAEWRRSEPALWTVGTQGDARLKAADVRLGDDGIAFEILEQGGDRASVKVPFIGHYNIVNLLGVVAALRALGHPLSLIVRVLGQLTPVPGRLERCSVGVDEPLAVVDYAHTPDALDKALKALRPVAQARGGALWCVFGCGGDRDRSKRAPMGAMAAGGADHIVLTSDNPRTEDPVRIIRDIRAADLGDDGRDGTTPTVVEEPDRARAVARALGQAQAADVVLVAGKGHEDYQEIAGVRHPQRDHDLIAQALQLRRASQGFMKLDQVARFIPGGRLVGAASLPIARVHTDTRTLQPGDLYVALRGERFDGHDFLAQARQAGAVAALAERGLDPQTMPGVEVPDSLQALQALAQAWRAQLQMPVVAVTGSNGKTTTTQMIASILRAWLGDAAAATRGNLNNHIGVPLTVLALRGGPDGAAHRAAVIELGMNHPGEIAQLAAIAQPTVALVNNAQREHQEFMGTVEAVARENGSVLLSLPPGGAAVFPAQDEYAPLWAAMAGGAKLWRFAWHRVAGAAGGALDHAAPAEVQGWAEDRGDHWALRLNTPLGSIDTTLVLPGEHNVHNAMAAAACALAAGAPLHAVAQGLADFRGVQGRSRRIVAQRGGRPITLVDDSYNANPDSVRAAIDLLAELPGPRALILGDMGEVGQEGPAFHEEVGQYAAQRGLEHLWCSGALTEHAVQAASAVRAAQAATAGSARHFESVPALIEALDQLPPVASILVKGSRFMRMERVVQALHPAEREGH